jgi:hypothetical protein
VPPGTGRAGSKLGPRTVLPFKGLRVLNFKARSCGVGCILEERFHMGRGAEVFLVAIQESDGTQRKFAFNQSETPVDRSVLVG